MDMHPREQYLESLREEYGGADKKQKTRLLNEARKSTRLNRRVLIRNLGGVEALSRSALAAGAIGLCNQDKLHPRICIAQNNQGNSFDIRG